VLDSIAGFVKTTGAIAILKLLHEQSPSSNSLHFFPLVFPDNHTGKHCIVRRFWKILDHCVTYFYPKKQIVVRNYGELDYAGRKNGRSTVVFMCHILELSAGSSDGQLKACLFN